MALQQVRAVRDQWRGWDSRAKERRPGITRRGWRRREESPDCAGGPNWKATAGVQAGNSARARTGGRAMKWTQCVEDDKAAGTQDDSVQIY